MIRHIDVVAFWVQILGPVHADSRSDGPGDQAAPPPGTPMLHSSGMIEGRQCKRNRRHYHGVEIPEQVRKRRPRINQYLLEFIHANKKQTKYQNRYSGGLPSLVSGKAARL